MKIRKSAVIFSAVLAAVVNMSVMPSYAETNNASMSERHVDIIDFDTYGRYPFSYNNGFKITDRIQEKTDTAGNIYAFCGVKDVVYMIPENSGLATVTFANSGFTFGAATIGDDGNVYIMWGKDIVKGSDDGNIIIGKYDMSGNMLDSLVMAFSETDAQYPFASGNANINYKNGILGVFFDTKWTSLHQGSEFAAVDTRDMSLVYFNDWQGSHSLGVSMLTTDYGFEAVQMGDAYPRGINMNRYRVDENGSFSFGQDGIVIFHTSGQYGSNEGQIDGNTTYTHLGGFAKSGDTYALAGKSERAYTSDPYHNSALRTKNFDVFVRFIDQSFEKSDRITVGEDRTDAATGEVADSNVVWLTQCDNVIETGDVKVVTLDSGDYCILWEEFIDGRFDSIYYIITDRYGNTVREKSSITGAYLSNTSVPPVVQGSTLTWAVADSDKSSLIWYKVNLDESGTDVVIGDVSGDGVINSVDASYVLLEYATVSTGGTTTLSDRQRTSADINGDNMINAYDASKILEFYTYLSTGGGKLDMREWLARQ